ncbi:MAG: hypothetical protein QXO99_08285 [Candidatus Methanomethylicia archaeon]
MDKEDLKRAFELIILTIMFCVGIQLVDISASAMIIGSKINSAVFLGSLIVDEMDPRVAYHLGLLILVTLWIVACLLILYLQYKM